MLKLVSGATAAGSAATADRVVLGLSAELRELGMLRALTDTVCLLADIEMSAVADIRLVLSEAATALLVDAAPGSTLGCEFSYTADRFDARLTATTVRDIEVVRDPLSWQLVRMLTDSAELVSDPFDPAAGGYPTAIEFTWERGKSDGT